MSAKHSANDLQVRVSQAPERTHTVYRPPWRVDVVRRAGIWVPISASAVAAAVTSALETAGAPAPGSVTVVFTDDPELAELNLEHMGIESATDVLSFPMLAPEVFGTSSISVPAASPKATLWNVWLIAKPALAIASRDSIRGSTRTKFRSAKA